MTQQMAYHPLPESEVSLAHLHRRFAKDYATEGLPESAYGYYRSWAQDLENMFGLGYVSFKFFVVSRITVGKLEGQLRYGYFK